MIDLIRFPLLVSQNPSHLIPGPVFEKCATSNKTVSDSERTGSQVLRVLSAVVVSNNVAFDLRLLPKRFPEYKSTAPQDRKEYSSRSYLLAFTFRARRS